MCVSSVHIKPIMVMIACTLMQELASGEILVLPKDVDAVVGSSVTFNCSSSIIVTDVQWNHYPTIRKSVQVIYAYGKINSQYSERFSVQNGHNLHISSVTVDDAGTYECQDDYGHGEKRSAELTVLEENPVCRSFGTSRVVGSNKCGIEPSQVSLSCYVKYQGNKVPTLEWRESGDDQTITSGVRSEIRGNLVVHNLTMKGDSIVNGSSYNCRPAKASIATSCNSGNITILGESKKPIGSTCQQDLFMDSGIVNNLFCISNLMITSFIALLTLLTLVLMCRFKRQTRKQDKNDQHHINS